MVDRQICIWLYIFKKGFLHVSIFLENIKIYYKCISFVIEHTNGMPGTSSDQKMLSDPLLLEVQAVVSYLLVLRIKSQALWVNSQCFKC